MTTTIIEEGIYDINTRESIKKAIFTFDGKRLTRELFYGSGIGGKAVCYDRKNKVDVIDGTNININLPLSDILNPTIDYERILESIKERVENFDAQNVAQRNIDAELPAFKNPIITIR